MTDPPGPPAFPPPPSPQDAGSSGGFAPPPGAPTPPFAPAPPPQVAPPSRPVAPASQPVPPPGAGWPAGPPAGPAPMPPATPPSGSKARTSMFVVIGLAVAVIAAVVGVIVLGGGDDDERVAPDDTEAVDDTEAPDDTEATVPEPDETVVVDSTTPATEPTEPTEPTGPTVEPTTPVTAAPAGDVVAGAPAGVVGTREAPVPVGEIADIGSGWRLQVLDVVPDATALVAAENSFNDPPPAGSTFTIVRIALGYFGLEDPQSFFMPTISAIGAGAVELDTNCGVIPQQIDIFADAFAGGVAVGNICFVTTPADPPALQLYATGEFFSDTEVFLDARAPAAPVTAMAGLVGPQPGTTATAARAGATPIGTAADVGGGWSFAVVSPARDITDQVLAENTFNEPPPEGYRMVGVDVAVAYNGSGTGSLFDVTVSWVDDGNVERSGYCGVVPGELDVFADVFAGGSVTGTLCTLVPAEYVGTTTLYVTVGFEVEEPTYFAAS